MPILAMRATPSNFVKTEASEDRNHLPRLKYGGIRQASAHLHALRADEYAFQLRVTVLKQHLDDLT